MGDGFGEGGGDWFGPASFASCEDEEQGDDDDDDGREGEGPFNILGEVKGEGEEDDGELFSGGLTIKTSP